MGIKQPVLNAFANRMFHDGWGSCRKVFPQRGTDLDHVVNFTESSMRKGSRVSRIPAQKANNGGTQSEGRYRGRSAIRGWWALQLEGTVRFGGG